MIPVLHGVWAAAGGLVGDFEHIETQTVGAGGAASVTFSSIAGTYKHLQIRGVARSTTSGTGFDWIQFRLNSDSGSNYARHYLYGDGATATSGAGTSQTSAISYATLPRNGQTASAFGGFVFDLLDYASTSKNKTMRVLGGSDVNGSGFVALSSSVWLNTNAVTSITLASEANNLAQYSSFSLYGVK